MNNQLIKSVARNFVFPITVKLGLHKVLINNSNGILNIYFHGVSPRDFTQVSGRHMLLSQFDKLLKYLVNNYEIVEMNTSYNLGKPSGKKEKIISIGFDDGYYNNFKYLPDIIASYKVPVTIFVCGVALEQEDYLMWTDQIALMRYFLEGDFIEIKNIKYYKKGKFDLVNNVGVSLYDEIKKMGPINREPFLKELNEKYKTIELAKDFDEDYWKLMNAKQILELTNSGLFQIASHGMYHYNLANISSLEAKHDMLNSFELLSKTTGQKIDSISFPDGSYNNEVVETAKDIGFEKLWISSYNKKGDVNDPNLRSRFGISSTTNYYSNIISIHKAFKSYGI